MIDIYICEDNEKQLLVIKQKIENYVAMEQLDMQITVASQKPEDIVQQARHSKNCGLYFLDIDLKNSEMNGFLLAQEIREIEPRCFIVFVTSHIELCAYTFRYKVEALDFIMKDEPEKMGEQIRVCLLDVYKKYTGGSDSHKNIFSAGMPDGRSIAVEYDDIISIETASTTRHLILHARQRQFEFPGLIGALEKQLPGDFFRPHRSVVINLKNIDKVDYGELRIEMNDGSIVPLAVRKRGQLKSKLEHY